MDAAACSSPAAAAPLWALCGSERWLVKTLADPDRAKVSLIRRNRTIKQLNKLVKPSPLPQNSRVAAERLTFRVVGTVTLTRNEDDGDIHLAIVAGGKSIIAEAPEPACSVASRDRVPIRAARLVAQNVQPGDKGVAVGVGFFDFAHGQTGHADNFFEEVSGWRKIVVLPPTSARPVTKTTEDQLPFATDAVEPVERLCLLQVARLERRIEEIGAVLFEGRTYPPMTMLAIDEIPDN